MCIINADNSIVLWDQPLPPPLSAHWHVYHHFRYQYWAVGSTTASTTVCSVPYVSSMQTSALGCGMNHCLQYYLLSGMCIIICRQQHWAVGSTTAFSTNCSVQFATLLQIVVLGCGIKSITHQAYTILDTQTSLYVILYFTLLYFTLF